MEAFLEETQHLKIQLEEIKSATNNFDDNKIIGRGGFGKVYKGLLSHSKGQTTVAFKRLDRKYGQGSPEFLREIVMLSRYKHENLISLIGFCDEGGEKILVYEHADHGSLDRHLSATTLSWWTRLKICLAAAKGLCYLHEPKGTERIIHRDIKSSNILLDENWNAKISDFGLSKIGPANQQNSFLATNVVGTPGYTDPLYMESYFLTKESDVYSFGMVLFEVLSGRLCTEYHINGQVRRSLWPMWKKSYEKKKLDEIVFEDLKEQMCPSSLETFSDIAYQCLQLYREQRPKMSRVVEQLEIALHLQKTEGPVDFEEMIKTAVTPQVHESKEELRMLLYKGMLVNGDKTWFSLNKNEEHCEMISAAVCLSPILPPSPKYASSHIFPIDTPLCWRFKMHVKPQFLSPHVTYAINLVFDIDKINTDLLFLNYKLAEETYYSTSYIVDKREGGLFMTELYQFTSAKRSVDLNITFDCQRNPIRVEGIEFRPIERVEHQEDEEVDMPDTNWEQKLPSDYKDIIKRSKDSVQWATKKELYSLLCKGFPINDGEEWFSLTNDGRKCHMLPARIVLRKSEWSWGSLPGSRFNEVASFTQKTFSITCTSKVLSPLTRYACYLVYKIQTKNSNIGQVVEVSNGGWITKRAEYDPHHILLYLPETPVIKQKVKDKIQKPLMKKTDMKGVPQRRNDGWMEVQLWEWQTSYYTASDRVLFDFYLNLKSFARITKFMVQGIEFKVI